jgi:hypothetical protein
MNLHVAAKIEYDFGGEPTEIHLVRGDEKFVLNRKEWKEICAVLDGKREILHSEIKEGTYYPEYSIAYNKPES